MTDIPLREPDQLPGVPLPESRSGLFGHTAVHEALRAQLAARRLPGAVLLHGPRGIGKATLASVFAREIFTATGDETASRIAEQMDGGVYPNLFTLRRTIREKSAFYTVLRVDEVRDLKGRLRQTRSRAGWRVCIVDSIDDANASAANALLKMLEEPPPEAMFILVSHNPGGLLPTIRSRCRAFAMRPLNDDNTLAVLRDTLPDANEAGLDRAVALAGGRPRRGFEALALSADGALEALRRWLASPATTPPGVHLALADALASSGEAEIAFAREMLADFLADRARDAVLTGLRAPLASATALWDKAHALFSDVDVYNLDLRQAFVIVFDAIRRHDRLTAPAEAP